MIETVTRDSMEVRSADIADINACYALDGSGYTEYVWQMEEREENGVVNVIFRTTRLPRRMKLAYPVLDEHFLTGWQAGNFVRVADDAGKVVGFVHLRPQPLQEFAWIEHLVVARTHRRRGVGAALVQSANQWAASQALRRVLITTWTKNYPAIRFAQRHGFSFCGYNDRYFANGDIALYFAHNLH